jgi:hypothetical protein
VEDDGLGLLVEVCVIEVEAHGRHLEWGVLLDRGDLDRVQIPAEAAEGGEEEGRVLAAEDVSCKDHVVDGMLEVCVTVPGAWDGLGREEVGL